MTIGTAIVIILVASSGYFFGAQPSYGLSSQSPSHRGQKVLMPALFRET